MYTGVSAPGLVRAALWVTAASACAEDAQASACWQLREWQQSAEQYVVTQVAKVFLNTVELNDSPLSTSFPCYQSAIS